MLIVSGSELKLRFKTTALGGTFDYIHKGHKALFSKAFTSAENVLIGVSTDEFASRLGKTPDHNFKNRVEGLLKYLENTFPERDYQIVPLNDYFGTEIYADYVEAIVTSNEMLSRVTEFNKKRSNFGFKPLKVIVVETILSEDGSSLSSTRIRNGEVDEEGRVIH